MTLPSSRLTEVVGEAGQQFEPRGDMQPNGEWYQAGDWWLCHARTTKPLSRLTLEAPRGLDRGLAAFATTHQWQGQVLYVESIGCEGYVYLEEGRITCRIRFTWPLPSFLKKKIFSEVRSTLTDVAGGPPLGSKDVFIVHGHLQSAKTELTKLLRSLGLNPIVLEEQPHSGRTLIEQLEYHARTCSLAIVLMTPDDLMGGGGDPRVRQNVLMEIGWFMASLTRQRVVLLCQGKIELPSDLHGVLFYPFENNVNEVASELSHQLRDVGLV